MITPIKNPLTVSELRKMQDEEGQITAVVSVPWDEAGDIDDLNEKVSEMITECDYALEDIGYRLVGADVTNQAILLEVSGSVENWLESKEDEE